MLIAGGAVFVVILLATIGLLVWKLQQSNVDETAKAKETSERIIDKVSNLYLVPESEEPTVAVIQDKDKLGNKEFFKQAQNGDYLLVYPDGKIALVYREQDNKLINAGPVSIGDNDTVEKQGQTAGVKTPPDPMAP